jgi:hypothetical protein
MKLSPCAVDLYLRFTYPSVVIHRAYRVWDADKMLKFEQELHPQAKVEAIDHSTYLRGIKHAAAANGI